jgi:hypothetical protein
MNEEQIRRIITEAATSFEPDEELSCFLAALHKIYKENLDGVIFYGSCLTSKMRKPSSFRDFFILVHDYSPVIWGHARPHITDQFLLKIMPPTMYFLKIDYRGQTLESKYHLLTTREFRRMCSRYAPDHYVVGRMCKRTALVWFKDEEARNIILDSLTGAFFNNALLTVPRIVEPVDFKGFVLSCLQTSYLSELRLELPEKIHEIYESEKELYDDLYGLLAEDFVRSGLLTPPKAGEKTGTCTFLQGLYRSSAGGTWQLRKVKLYLWISKFRHIARFPKMIRNMDNWLDQLLGKYDRTYGKKLELSDFEKRHRAFTVLKYFYKIKVLRRP